MAEHQTTKDAFAIAKDALRLIGQFKTPPTPKVFEVWYRYAEGLDGAMVKQMSHAVTGAKSVSVQMLESIHDQYCKAIDETHNNVGESLVAELERFQLLVSQQKAAGTQFEGTIDAASEMLSGHESSSETSDACIESLSTGTSLMKRQLLDMAQKLDAAQAQVAILQNDLIASKRGMMIDHLTGIGNRRYFDTLLGKILQSANAEVDQLYLVLLDMDRLKVINDSYGHDAGDQAIQFVASQICELHPNVSLARLGGDEFAAVLQVASREESLQFADHLRDHFAKRKLTLEPSKKELGKFTFSMGVAQLRTNDDEKSWFSRADKLLYEAKNLGRNRVVVERAIN